MTDLHTRAITLLREIEILDEQARKCRELFLELKQKAFKELREIDETLAREAEKEAKKRLQK